MYDYVIDMYRSVEGRTSSQLALGAMISTLSDSSVFRDVMMSFIVESRVIDDLTSLPPSTLSLFVLSQIIKSAHPMVIENVMLSWLRPCHHLVPDSPFKVIDTIRAVQNFLSLSGSYDTTGYDGYLEDAESSVIKCVMSPSLVECSLSQFLLTPPSLSLHISKSSPNLWVEPRIIKLVFDVIEHGICSILSYMQSELSLPLDTAGPTPLGPTPTSGTDSPLNSSMISECNEVLNLYTSASGVIATLAAYHHVRDVDGVLISSL